MFTVRNTVLAAALVVLPFAATAHHVGEVWQAGSITVSHAWTEETGAMAHGIEVYLTIGNSGEEPDRLIAAETDFTEAGVFQASILDDDGSLIIKEVPAIQIAAGQALTMQPGGVHIVLQDVKRHLEGGEHFDMTLTFANAGTIEIEVEVEHGEDHDHDHDGHEVGS